jgi:hypothetical protein
MKTIRRPLPDLLACAFSWLLLIATCASLSACGLFNTFTASPTVDTETVLHTVREYGRGHKSVALALPATPPEEPENIYEAHITTLIAQENFAQLELEAKKAREEKGRVTGGTFKTLLFYETAATPLSTDTFKDSDYEAHFALINRWIHAFPQSATPRIALANLYQYYGGFARGSGYADTVTSTGWRLLGERVELAKATLLEAATLKDRDPYWYEIMENIALSQGWNNTDMRELVDNAVAFEPDYYHFRREYANDLQPRWHGQPGDSLRYAKEVADSLSEPSGSILYFELSSIEACYCDGDVESRFIPLSWPRAKEGYENLVRLYGFQNRKANRFALMAMMKHDRDSARMAFESIQSHDMGVWMNEDLFEYGRHWAYDSGESVSIPLRP